MLDMGKYKNSGKDNDTIENIPLYSLIDVND